MISRALQKPLLIALLKKASIFRLLGAETGGLIGGALTGVPGSSAVVEGGIISYSNDVKINVLGVSAADLERVGAVSSEVAASMAEGSLRVANSDIAVAVTGIAGPGRGCSWQARWHCLVWLGN